MKYRPKVLCPGCRKQIKKARVYQECYRIANVVHDEIEDWGPIQEVTEIVAVKCMHCGHDVSELLGM